MDPVTEAFVAVVICVLAIAGGGAMVKKKWSNKAILWNTLGGVLFVLGIISVVSPAGYVIDHTFIAALDQSDALTGFLGRWS